MFYYEGFRAMTVGKILWVIILVKLAVMFLILRPIFFPNFLKSKFENDDARVEYVTRELTAPVLNKY
jgi:hypothetical protein